MLYGAEDKLTCSFCGATFAAWDGGRRCGQCNHVACPLCLDRGFGDSDELCVDCQQDHPELLERELKRNQWGVTDTAPRSAAGGSADQQLPPGGQASKGE